AARSEHELPAQPAGDALRVPARERGVMKQPKNTMTMAQAQAGLAEAPAPIAAAMSGSGEARIKVVRFVEAQWFPKLGTLEYLDVEVPAVSQVVANVIWDRGLGLVHVYFRPEVKDAVKGAIRYTYPISRIDRIEEH